MHDPKRVAAAIAGVIMDDQIKQDFDMGPSSAAQRIMKRLWVHKRTIDGICLAGGKVESYILAYAGAMNAGAERLFLSLDSKRLSHALRNGKGDRIEYNLFSLLPFFESTEYLFHVMQNETLREILSAPELQGLNPDEKKMLCSKRFLSSRILTGLRTQQYARVTRISGLHTNRYSQAVRACTKNPETLRFLKYLASDFVPGTWFGAVEQADQIMNAGACERILRLLKHDRDSRDATLSLMAATAYDKGVIKAITAKIRTDAASYAAAIKDKTCCMMAAWVLGRDDVLRNGQEDWWQHGYEDAVLYAMVHKWDRFLAGFADNEKMREVALYLGRRGIQINANLLNDAQLIRIEAQDMLSKPLPEWLRKNETFDQIEAYHLINKDEPNKSTPFLNQIFETLSKHLRPEAAGKRVTQYMLARNAIFEPTPLAETETAEIIDCLSEKDLYAWAATSFRFKASHGLAAAALPYLRTNKVLEEAETEQEAWFILRNLELCKNGLDHAKETFCQTDKKVLWLKEFLGLDNQFYEKYKKESTAFLLESTEIAEAYAKDLYGDNDQKFRLIIKAAMCGKLRELKFHNGDLDSEIDTVTSPRAAAAWIPDISVACRDKFGGTCAEDSTFNGIMSIGVHPLWTCMNYRNGTYRECLISYFDANKKILYRRDADGQIIARAVLRFTKAIDGEARTSGRLDFVDVENEQNSEGGYPILFLERMYSGYQGTDRTMLAQSLIRAAGEKAAQMGVSLVLAYDYIDLGIVPAGFSKTRVSVYITKSKSFAQYLDSFGGKATYGRGEDSFQSTTCLIRRA